MTNTKEIVVVSIPATAAALSAIFEPTRMGAAGERLYRMAVPFEGNEKALANCFVGRRGYVSATSVYEPLIMLESTGLKDRHDWEELLRRADSWKFPRDQLLVDFPLQVALLLYDRRVAPYRGPPRAPGEEDRMPVVKSASLQAVRIGAGIDGEKPYGKSAALEAHIIEKRSWFAEY